MDFYSNKQPSASNLIKIMFYLILSVIVVAFLLFIFLNVNQMVSAKSGEIISENAPQLYRAPFESLTKEIRIHEGDLVHTGDTLIILHNEQLVSNYEKAKNEYDLSNKKITINQNLLEKLSNRVQSQKKQVKNITRGFGYNKKSGNIELETLREQVELMKKKVDSAKARYTKDYFLFKDGVISQQAYSQKYQAYMDQLNQFSEIKKRYQLQKSAAGSIKNEYANKMNQQELTISGSEEEYFNIEKTLAEEESNLLRIDNQLTYLSNELEKQYIISDIEGHISFLFNVKKEANFISKGELLVKVTPNTEEEFYAKLNVSQKSISKVRVGQPVHIKVDAYHHYQYGIVKGTVSYIASSDTTSNFYILAEIPQQEKNFNLKSGYRIEGDIISDRLKLYKYVFRKLFKKMEII